MRRGELAQPDMAPYPYRSRAWAIVVAVAFAVVAVTNANGMFYGVVGIVAAAGYSMIAVLTRRPTAGAGHPVPARPGPQSCCPGIAT
jgi:hypothetical protein